MGNPRVYRFHISDQSSAMRLDQVLSCEIPDLSRTKARQLIDLGGVHIDGRRVRRCSQQIRAGMHVELFLDDLPLQPWALLATDILAEDAYHLVINKPSGVDTQPTPARYKGTLYHALLSYLEGTRGAGKVELGMVQRLDRGTSGAIVFSIHRRAHRALTETLSERQADKRYLALVDGVPAPAAGEIRSLLARNRATNLVRSVAHGGKDAITRYRTLGVIGKTALVEAQLVTGRTHQIRAHFAEAGFPLCGDQRYGGQGQMAGVVLDHPLLHSWRLSLRHPIHQTEREYTAPLPEIWARVWTALGQDLATLNGLLENAAEKPSMENP